MTETAAGAEMRGEQSVINHPELKTTIVLFSHESAVWAGLSWMVLLLVLPAVSSVLAFV